MDKQKKEIKFNTRYNRKEYKGVYFKKPSLTQQCFKDECDINNILKRYQSTGELIVNSQKGEYLDVSGYQDLQTMHIYMQQAYDAFNELPDSIKKQFDYDARKFFHYHQERALHENMFMESDDKINNLEVDKKKISNDTKKTGDVDAS